MAKLVCDVNAGEISQRPYPSQLFITLYTTDWTFYVFHPELNMLGCENTFL